MANTLHARLDAQTAHLLDAIRVASTARTPVQDAAADHNAVSAVYEVLELVAEVAEQDAREERAAERPRLTRNERLQAAADAGFDTWDDYHGDR